MARSDKGAELAVDDEALDVRRGGLQRWDRGQRESNAEARRTQHSPAQEPIQSLEGTDGELTKIVFKSGPDLPRAGLFFSTGCHQASDLSKILGCKRNEKGGVVIDPDTEESSVPGVYVAGDVSRDVLLVAVAIAEGAQAAVAINKAFLRRDGFCDCRIFSSSFLLGLWKPTPDADRINQEEDDVLND